MTAASIWSSSDGSVEAHLADGVAVITIDRPKKANALTARMKRDLSTVIRQLGTGGDASGIVVTGSGRAFFAGQDLNELQGDDADLDEAISLFHDLTRAVLETKVPIIAALNGPVVGGAAEWTLCFDTRIAVPDCFYVLPERGIGVPVSNASGLLLFRLLKGGAAMRMVFDARRVHADEALRIGLVDAIVAAPQLVAAAVSTVNQWCGPDGKMPTAYLELLRPSLDQVEAAMRRETEAGRSLRRSRGRGTIQPFARERDP